MIVPSFETYRDLAAVHEIVPVYREILADEETPVSVYRKLTPFRPIALLESVEGGERWGRYSLIALDPTTVFESRGTSLEIREPGRDPERVQSEQPFHELERRVRARACAALPNLPGMAGGAVGFAGYDLVRRFERLPERTEDDLDLPDCRFVFFETAVVFDHQFHMLALVVNTRPGAQPRAAFDAALARIDEIAARLRAPVPEAPPVRSRPALQLTSSMARGDYEAAVERAKAYIRAGDIFQVVLAHRLETEIFTDPFDVYRALRVINPSPYMFHLALEDLTVVGASPEVLVRRQGALIETRPIAGTRPRGADEAADRDYERDLLASEKERAEHVMLVDLGRNDLGRVARHGTVETREFMAVERYSHVMHLVSSVRAEVGPECANADVLAACFPAGTVSGAPKIRAMEIIEELEPVRRGVYAGAVGYLDLHGNMDTCIAIRTLWVREGRAYLGVGAGIVADSDPAAEYSETMGKAGAVLRALELAHEGLDRFSRAAAAPRPSEVPARSRRGKHA